MPLTPERVALVTGSTSGIGEAVVRRLAADGLRVVVNSVTSVDAGAALVADIGPEAAHYVQADVADEADAQRLVDETVERFGRLDVLVNNAGTTVRIDHNDFEAATPELFRRIFDVNVVAAWQMSVKALPHLTASGAGVIVNVSSLGGVRPVGSSIPYSVSKAALNHLTALLANVTGPAVRVNAVAPGLIETPWTAEWPDQLEMVPLIAPLARVGTPDDIAHVVMALIDAEYVTGQVWVADGGVGLR